VSGSDYAVETVGLSRVFPLSGGRVRVALDGVDLRIPAAEVRGLLGPNGAGKTTLCKILSTGLMPSSGRALVCGADVVAETARVRRVIGIAFGGERGLYTRISARQNLHYWAALYGLSRREARRRGEQLLERVGLTERADERVETFSRGMKQRLHLARGLVGDPRVLFLDEPTVGMDPVAAQAFRDLVLDLQAEGRTVLLTTHDMAEAEAVCDRISLIDNGRILATEDPRTIGDWLTAYERIEARGVGESTVAKVAALPGVAAVHRTGPQLCQIDLTANDATDRVMRALLDEGVTQISARRPSLEEVYLHVFGDRGWEVR
jgi:ABC-2 type transport system ATP-binding protein